MQRSLLLLFIFWFGSASVIAQKTCKTALPDAQFAQYKEAVTAESFSSNQMEVAKAGGKCLSTNQIKTIMQIFSFENMRLEFAKWAYPTCVDKSNYFLLNSAFNFSSSKTELNQFVAKQGTAEEATSEETPDQTEEEIVTPVPPTKPKTVVVKRKNEQVTPIDITNDYNEAFKKAQKEMDAFFVMTLGGEDNEIGKEDVHKPSEDESTLPAKAPRIVITAPEISKENNYTATVPSKLCKVSGVISSSVGIYEVYINETEAILNPKGEFSGDVMLAPGENKVQIKAKDVKGQIAAIGIKIVREGEKETVKPEPTPVVPPKVEPPAAPSDFVSEIDLAIPKLKNTNKDGIAVVIGNSKYNRTKPVDFAVNDARSMKNYLINVLGYKEGNILYYENATLGDMNTIFGTKGNPKGRLFNTIKQGVSDVIIFYSGHGAPGLKDSKAYFVPVEADPNYMENSGYALDILYENLKKLPAKSITFFSDACFSGANVFDKISPMVIRSKEPVKEGMKNTTLINSCTGSEVSCWHNEEKHGLFTFYLLKAMKDFAETDRNKDRQVTLDEIFTSLSDNNEAVPYYARRQYGLTQTPVIQGPKTKVLFKY